MHCQLTCGASGSSSDDGPFQGLRELTRYCTASDPQDVRFPPLSRENGVSFRGRMYMSSLISLRHVAMASAHLRREYC